MNAISSSPNTSRTFKQSLKQGQQAHQIHLFWPFCNPGFALGFYHVLSQFLGTNILHQIAKMPPLVGFLCDHVCISRLQHLHATSHANLGWGINWRGTCQASSYMYVCIYIYIYIYICVCFCVCIYVYVYVYAHVYVFIYIYMCVCVYTSSTPQGGGGSFKNRKPIGGLVVVTHGWQSKSTDGPKGGWSCVFWSGCDGCSGHLTTTAECSVV